jgi:hypothetical protein
MGGLQYHPPNKRMMLKNRTCAYCHRPFDKDLRPEEEHVIGRRFVPRGTLAKQWNLILRSCRECNERKAELENDISAITMIPDEFGRFETDESTVSEAVRKGTTISRRTGKPVADSHEELEHEVQMVPGLTLRTRFVAGPQLDQDRAFELAMFHVAGFFYRNTYDEMNRVGRPVPGVWVPMRLFRRSDWGNELLLAFQDMTSTWAPRVHGIAAGGFFKIIIRRHPEPEPALWSWALEWNKNYRLSGMFGDEDKAVSVAATLPKLKVWFAGEGSDEMGRPYRDTRRVEVPLADENDRLFGTPAS